jgi:hypothetical protein
MAFQPRLKSDGTPCCFRTTEDGALLSESSRGPAARVAIVHLTIRANDRGRFTIHGLIPGTRVHFLEFGAEPLDVRSTVLRVEFCDGALRDRVSRSRRRRLVIL